MTPSRSSWRIDKKRLLMALLGLVVGVEFLENGMFVFASSHIIGGVDAAPREFAQVQAAYAIGSMLMIVLQQWLSRHFGYRRYLAGAIALFMAGALVSANAGDLPGLTLGRLIQGVGGGALFTSSRVLVPTLFAPADRPRALKYFMVTIFGIGALAPLLAATLVEEWGWHWIFLSVLPVAALTLAGVWTLLPDGAGRGSAPVRWAVGPLVLFALAISCVQWGLTEARYEAFAHPAQLAMVAMLGCALLVGFLLHQWRHDEPLLRLRELRHPTYLAGLGLYFIYYFLSNFSNYLFPIFAERSLGLPLATAGWLTAFSATVSLVGAYAYIRFSARMPRKKLLMAAGPLALVASAWLFARLPPGAPWGALGLGLAVKGLFGVMMVLPVAGLTFRDLDEERFAHGYQSKNLLRQIAGSFSAAIAAILLQNRQFANYADLSSRLSSANPGAAHWLDTLQAGFAAQGLAPGAAHGAALAELARLVDQQALLLACEDLYRLLGALALATTVVVLVQRRLK
jgi:DHA2 family multidrug resistance protein